MTGKQTTNEGFLEAIERFEHTVETPVVSGELPDWLLAAQKACDEAGQMLRRQIEDTHAQMLREMNDQDLELMPRVEELKADDEALLERWKSIRLEFERLTEAAKNVEPHEVKLDEEVEQLIKNSLDFVIAARRHETALTTWYVESFNRDRGVID